MKRCLVILLLISVSQYISAQKIKSSDGRVLGTRQQFMDACVKKGTKTTMTLKGAEVDVKSYCSCFADRLLPSLTYKEIKKALANGTFADLLMEDKNLNILMDCIGESAKVDSSYSLDQYDKPKDTVLIRKMSIRTCVLDFARSGDTSSMMTPEMQEAYCDCAINKLFGRGFNLYDVAQLKDTNSLLYNEIVLPCVTHLIFKYNLPKERNI
jgi:hypothetical protein